MQGREPKGGVNGAIHQKEVSSCHIINSQLKNIAWNPSTCICENGKYLASIKADSIITFDEIINMEETDFNERN